MVKTVFSDIKNKLLAIDEIKLVEWYLEQDKQKGGIVNTPCILVRFEPAPITQISKMQKQADIRFELYLYSDFKKGNAKVGTATDLHFRLEEKIEEALTEYEQTGFDPMKKQDGLLKSAMQYIRRTTACLPTKGKKTILTKNITMVADTTC